MPEPQHQHGACGVCVPRCVRRRRTARDSEREQALGLRPPTVTRAQAVPPARPRRLLRGCMVPPVVPPATLRLSSTTYSCTSTFDTSHFSLTAACAIAHACVREIPAGAKFVLTSQAVLYSNTLGAVPRLYTCATFIVGTVNGPISCTLDFQKLTLSAYEILYRSYVPYQRGTYECMMVTAVYVY